MEKQIQINFDPVEHKYTDDSGLVYTSVTTVIGKYKEPFNKDYWSMYTALKNSGFKVRPCDDRKTIVVNGIYRSLEGLYKNPINSLEVRNLVNNWKVLTEQACNRGNDIHNYLEDSINISKGDEAGESNSVITPQLSNSLNATGLTVEIRTQHDLDKTNLKATFPVIYDRLLAYINMGCVLFAEKRIYTSQYQIAGMIDVLIVHLKSKRFAILDWKTNKDEMHFISGYYKKVKVGNTYVKGMEFVQTNNTLMYPINNLPECKGMVYTMQLSLYAFIMELWGYSLVKGGLEIFHLRPNQEPKLIRVDYKKEEVVKMLTHYKKNNNNNLKTKPKFGIK